MAHIAFGIISAGVVGAFDAVDFIEAAVHRVFEANVVEDEEFEFRSENGGVADAGLFQIGLGATCGRTRIAAIGLACARLDDVTEKDKLFLRRKRIHDSARAIGQQRHVGFVDVFPAGDRRSVEHDAVRQHVFVHGTDRLGCVLPLAAGVGEPEVHVLDVVFLNHLEDVFDIVRHRCVPFCDVSLDCDEIRAGKRTGRDLPG